mmetsp:Transcript_104495/g.336992  ORF Transcript_104495/g.336992 Transcript_104495/m.336992 type:complete len:304 (-) Transcript_104495:84-995(-)
MRVPVHAVYLVLEAQGMSQLVSSQALQLTARTQVQRLAPRLESHLVPRHLTDVRPASRLDAFDHDGRNLIACVETFALHVLELQARNLLLHVLHRCFKCNPGFDVGTAPIAVTHLAVLPKLLTKGFLRLVCDIRLRPWLAELPALALISRVAPNLSSSIWVPAKVSRQVRFGVLLRCLRVLVGPLRVPRLALDAALRPALAAAVAGPGRARALLAASGVQHVALQQAVARARAGALLEPLPSPRAVAVLAQAALVLGGPDGARPQRRAEAHEAQRSLGLEQQGVRDDGLGAAEAIQSLGLKAP